MMPDDLRREYLAHMEASLDILADEIVTGDHTGVALCDEAARERAKALIAELRYLVNNKALAVVSQGAYRWFGFDRPKLH
jgi:hypothetical protein